MKCIRKGTTKPSITYCGDKTQDDTYSNHYSKRDLIKDDVCLACLLEYTNDLEISVIIRQTNINTQIKRLKTMIDSLNRLNKIKSDIIELYNVKL